MPNLPKLTSKWGIALIVLGLLAVAVLGDYVFRCYGRPLSREEALQRAHSQLQYLSNDFALGDPPPSLAGEQYDSEQKSWILTFRNATCEVSIITDRCHGTDIGGLSEGCTRVKRPSQ